VLVRWRTEPNRFARQLFEGLPARYDLLAEVLSFGQNRRWRNSLVERVAVPPGARVLDVAAGTAGVALALERRRGAKVVALDLTESMVRRGVANVREAGRADRVCFVVGQAERLPFPDQAFDALTFGYLLRYVTDPAATVRELARVVRPGGPVASLDFAVPRGRLWRGLWHLYCRAVLPLGGLALGGRAWFDVGRFLGPGIVAFYRRFPVSFLAEAWRGAGLGSVGTRFMSLGGGLVMWGARERDGG
jgi:demethylmenaquinone methyltransferase / 2-methoxy-6-polyprenyl-1,4-benzoquinol methylase